MYDNSHKFTASQHYFSGHNVLNLVLVVLKWVTTFSRMSGRILTTFLRTILGKNCFIASVAWVRFYFSCFDTQQCCSSVKEWYGCCDKSSTTAVLDKPVSIKLVKHKEISCRVGYRGGGLIAVSSRELRSMLIHANDGVGWGRGAVLKRSD